MNISYSKDFPVSKASEDGVVVYTIKIFTNLLVKCIVHKHTIHLKLKFANGEKTLLLINLDNPTK